MTFRLLSRHTFELVVIRGAFFVAFVELGTSRLPCWTISFWTGYFFEVVQLMVQNATPPAFTGVWIVYFGLLPASESASELLTAAANNGSEIFKDLSCIVFFGLGAALLSANAIATGI